MNDTDIANQFIVNGVPVWEAETEMEADLIEDVQMKLTYKGQHHSFWTYSDIKKALDFGVDKFVEDLIQYETVTQQNIEELERFFTEWVIIVESNSNENWT